MVHQLNESLKAPNRCRQHVEDWFLGGWAGPNVSRLNLLGRFGRTRTQDTGFWCMFNQVADGFASATIWHSLESHQMINLTCAALNRDPNSKYPSSPPRLAEVNRGLAGIRILDWLYIEVVPRTPRIQNTPKPESFTCSVGQEACVGRKHLACVGEHQLVQRPCPQHRCHHRTHSSQLRL